MAVMTSPAPDKPSLEAKAQPVPSEESMAVDSHINGVDHQHDAPFDETALLPDQPTTNGDSAPTEVNTADSASAPITDVSNGIDPVAPFLPGTTSDQNQLFDTLDTAPSTVPPAVEAPTSDLRDLELSAAEIAAQTEDQPHTNGEVDKATQEVPAQEPVSAPSDAMQVDTPRDTSSAVRRDSDTMDVAAERPSETPKVADLPPTSDVEAATAPLAPESTEPSQPPPPEGQSVATEAKPAADNSEPVTAGKTRPREEDDHDHEHQAKRTKTEEASPTSPEFKLPEQPASSAPDQNGAVNGDATASTEPSAPKAVAPEENYSTTPLTEPQKKFLLEKVRATKKTKAALAFNKPVDIVALNIPNYPDIIKNPMDLSTLEQNLKDGKYVSLADFMADFNLIISNCLTFNGPTHPISHNASDLKRYFIKGLNQMPSQHVAQVLPKKKKQHSAGAAGERRQRAPAAPKAKSPAVAATSPTNQAFALQPDGVPIVRRGSSAIEDGRPKRTIVRPPPKDLPYSKPRKRKFMIELKFCEHVRNEMMKQKHQPYSYAFAQPVDPVALNIPSYHKIIKKPMDMGTISHKLNAGEYERAKDFEADVRLMFNNCYKFNPPNDPVHMMGKQYEEVFDSLWAQKQEWIEARTPQSPPEPDSDGSEEEEEEESDDEDLKATQIRLLQEQLATLSNQLTELNTKKGTKKKKAAKADAKPRKGSIAAAAPSKVKPKKKNAAPLTFEQKSEISEGIASLNDADMSKAIQIIRNGVPKLRNVNEEELEIEMEELPNEVLRELLKFVHQVRGTTKVKDDDDDFEPPVPKSHAPTNKPKKNKPMGKKEQEEKIRQIQEQLNAFRNGGAAMSPQPAPAQDSSDEEEESASESEEE